MKPTEPLDSARAAWQQRRLLRNVWVLTGSGPVVELLKGDRWDAITLDLQHGLFGLDRCIDLLPLLARAPMIPLVRVSGLDAAEIGKVLDAGARGVICPCVESANAVGDLIRACRYPPEGARSVTTFPPRMENPAAPAEAQRALAIAMIESETGLRHAEEIARVPGLDGIYIGPSDLGLALTGRSGLDRDEPELIAAIEKILRATKGTSVRVGLHCGPSPYWRRWLPQGLGLVTLTTDVRLIQAGSRDALARSD
jgi:4-hydroxy-2-oxoheptanedioate aldolase